MLVIARRRGEALRIGEDITIVVREIRGKQVKLTISAPPSVAIARAELDPVPRAGAATAESQLEEPRRIDGDTYGGQP